MRGVACLFLMGIFTFLPFSLVANDNLALLLEKLEEQERFFYDELFCKEKTFPEQQERRLVSEFLKKLDEQKKLVQKEFEELIDLRA